MFFHLVNPASAISYRVNTKHSWNPLCLINPMFCRLKRLNRRDSEAVRADDSNDVTAIKRQKGVAKGVFKLICKLFPKFLPCKFLGRNRRDFEAVRADDSLPASSSSTHDIQGPKLRMNYGEEQGERADAGYANSIFKVFFWTSLTIRPGKNPRLSFCFSCPKSYRTVKVRHKIFNFTHNSIHNPNSNLTPNPNSKP